MLKSCSLGTCGAAVGAAVDVSAAVVVTFFVFPTLNADRNVLENLPPDCASPRNMTPMRHAKATRIPIYLAALPCNAREPAMLLVVRWFHL